VLLRITFLTLAVVYVGYRILLALKIARAKRRGDAEREQKLRRQSFWALQGTVLVLLLLVLGFLGILGLKGH
jgi:cell division protein FtsW (lipid II flippase)